MGAEFNIPADLLAEIDAYYAGELSPQASATLRQRLLADPELTRAAAHYEALYRHGLRFDGPGAVGERAGLRDTLHQLEASLDPVPVATRTPRLWPRLAAAAAVILLCLLAGWWVLDRPGPNVQLARDNFAWLPREGARLGPAEDVRYGVSAYDQQEYATALPLLREGVAAGAIDSINLLYAGVSALAVGEAQTARDLITEVLTTEQYPYDEADMRYYLGLAELELDNPSAARQQLQQALDLQTRFSDRAEAMLRGLPQD